MIIYACAKGVKEYDHREFFDLKVSKMISKVNNYALLINLSHVLHYIPVI